MLVNKNPQLIKTFADYIELDSVRAAYYVMLGAVAAHPHLDCYPENKGEIRDFRLYASVKKQPFAFIVNKKSLLFYLRKPALDSKL